jgi:MoaA/NifB/PqqE/SkfB family radical SAM enzyme
MKLNSAESGSALETSLQQLKTDVEVSSDSHVIETLPVLVVHAHTSCNCRCIMCDIWKTREGKSFGVHDLEPHIASIKKLGVSWLVFSGGEPLLNPQLPLLCARLRNENIRLTLLTTGLLLQKCAADVATSFDDIIISLDGPPEVHDTIRRVDGAFALIATGIKAARQHRHDLPITARTTIQKANHHRLRETVQAAQQIHLDGISFLAADLTSTAFNRPLAWPVDRQDEIGLSLVEADALDGEIEALIAETPCGTKDGFVAETPDKLRRIARHFRVHLGLQPAEAPMCNAPWVSAVVEVDGSVRPCFFHPPIGNLQVGTLESILNGPQARSFRQNLVIQENSICRRCVCSLHYRL